MPGLPFSCVSVSVTVFLLLVFVFVSFCLSVCTRFMLLVGLALLLVFALLALSISLGPLQVVGSMPLICTTVLLGHGRRLGSAWRAAIWPPLLLGTWPSSRGEVLEVSLLFEGELLE